MSDMNVSGNEKAIRDEIARVERELLSDNGRLKALRGMLDEAIRMDKHTKDWPEDMRLHNDRSYLRTRRCDVELAIMALNQVVHGSNYLPNNAVHDNRVDVHWMIQQLNGILLSMDMMGWPKDNNYRLERR